MPRPSIHLASLCYGGLAQARFMRSVIALRRACEARGVALKVDLSGGEALVSRGRGGVLARFLGGEATHLVFAEAEAAFGPDEVLDLVNSDAAVATSGELPVDADLRPALLVVRRDAAERMVDAYGELRGGLADLGGGGAAPVPMLFESLIEPASGRYLADVAAFLERWRRVDAGFSPVAP